MTHFSSPQRRPSLSLLVLTALLVLAGCEQASLPTAVREADEPESGLEDNSIVPGAYIVVLDDRAAGKNAEAVVAELTQIRGVEANHIYTSALSGFAATLSDEARAEIERDPRVRYVEPNRRARLFTLDEAASWGLDRVDQHDLPLTGSYTYANDGSGAHLYILDTGVRRSHSAFGGRVRFVPNGHSGDFVGDGYGSAEDCHGHGTHVAGIAAGSTYGVAKNAPIWAARVIDCNGRGTVDMAIAAVDWITANGERPAVVNMSLGYGDAQSLRDAVERSVAQGVHYAVAAGNGHWLFGTPLDACRESPAGAPGANTVGATDRSDREASFSNYGPCVDLLAPGVEIASADYRSDTDARVQTGTSAAAPHVAGAVALYLMENPEASPAQVSSWLTHSASANRIALHSSSQSGSTPNLLLYTLALGGSEDGAPGGPAARFTYDCTYLDCSFTDQSTAGDGALTSWRWHFGDGTDAGSQHPSHAYAAAGTYTVTLTVTDETGAASSTSQNLAVEPPPSDARITLEAAKRSWWNYSLVDLSWKGATSSSVDVYRDRALVHTTANDGAASYNLGWKKTGTFAFTVCEAGTTTCSNEVSVTF